MSKHEIKKQDRFENVLAIRTHVSWYLRTHESPSLQEYDVTSILKFESNFKYVLKLFKFIKIDTLYKCVYFYFFTLLFCWLI